MMDDGGMNGGMMGGGFFGYGILFILIILAIIFITVWMFRSKPKHREDHSSETSHETLKRRLAKGEISEEEYDRMKRKLEE
ncbi:SHOCT domain-containing protein [Pseudalkalibacillus sp. SCS-8]|uniref:SHOCT domain-containing protein n=1 Tax=Pseudalkalibacillus nanhaiensis TaxID=3115291 RepID=UPI0032DBB071